MADTFKRVGPGQLTTSAATQYTVPASTSAVLRSVHVSNSSTSQAVAFSLSVGTMGATTMLYDAISIPANGALDWGTSIPLATGETLQAKASVSSSLVLTMGAIETI